VLFSCVRSTDGRRRRGIGFVADERRINVGLTRARCALIVIGNARSLAVDERCGAGRAGRRAGRAGRAGGGGPGERRARGAVGSRGQRGTSARRNPLPL
jgi:hypothetical protein